MPRIAAYYRKILQKIFHYPLFYSILFITPCLLGLYAGTQLITQFFPAVDYHQFQVKVQLPSSAGLDETRRQVQQVRKLIHEYPAVKSSHWFIGDNPPRVFYNEVTNRRGESNYAEGFVVMESHADVVKLLPELQTRLRDTFTQAMVLASPYIQGPTIYAPLEIKIKGENIGTLHQLGNQIRLLLSQSKNVIYSVASMSSGQAKLHLDLAGTSAIMAGTDPQQLNRQLRHRLQGLEGGAVLTFRNDIPVRIQTTADDRRNLHKMLGLPMRSGPLSAPGEFPFQDGLSLNGHAKISLVPETEAIVRDYMINTNLILAYITPYTLPDVALNDFKQRLAQSDIHLPAGYAIEFGGESKSRNESQQQLLSTLVPLLLIMVSIIVLSFNSFRMASIILLVAFLSIGAGTAALYIFSYPLSFFSVLGLMGLMGIAINDSIVILIALLRHANSGQCVSVDSATEVVVEETRHIIATTLTSIAGFIPLILWGASSYPPLAIAMAGGVIGATLLALFLVPCLFILLRKTVRNNNATPA